MTPQELLKLASDQCDHAPLEPGDPPRKWGLCCEAMEAAELWQMVIDQKNCACLARDGLVIMLNHLNDELDLPHSAKPTIYDIQKLRHERDSLLSDARKWREFTAESGDPFAFRRQSLHTLLELQKCCKERDRYREARDCYFRALQAIVLLDARDGKTLTGAQRLAGEALTEEKP